MVKSKEQEIKKITNQIKKKYKPEKIILFGSFAYGEATKDSDVDLFIIKKNERGENKTPPKSGQDAFRQNRPFGYLSLYPPRDKKANIAWRFFY